MRKRDCYFDEFSRTDFMLAVKANNLKVSNYLLEHNKYDINKKIIYGGNVLLSCKYSDSGQLEHY